MGELIITTKDGTVGAPERWLAFVSRELQHPDGFIIVRERGRDSYAQAANDGGTLLLEYRDGSAERHFQASGVGIGAVAAALSQWARGERDFIEDHSWTRLTLWDQDPKGQVGESPANP